MARGYFKFNYRDEHVAYLLKEIVRVDQHTHDVSMLYDLGVDTDELKVNDLPSDDFKPTGISFHTKKESDYICELISVLRQEEIKLQLAYGTD